MAEKAIESFAEGERVAGSRSVARRSRRRDCFGLQYQSGQYTQVLAEYKRGQDQIPEEVRAEMMLLVGQQPTPARTYARKRTNLPANHREVSESGGSKRRAVSAADQYLQFQCAFAPGGGGCIPESQSDSGERADQGEAAEGGSIFTKNRTSLMRRRSTRNCALPISRRSCARKLPINWVGVVCS